MNEKGLSPIVGIVLVLAVTAIAGVALYQWWSSMQASAQENVGGQTEKQFEKMALESATISIIIPGHMTDYNRENSCEYIGSAFDWDNNKIIAKASTSETYYGPLGNGEYCSSNEDGEAKYTNCYKDERFIQEIPVILRNDGTIDLHNVKLEVQGLEGHLWYALHFKKTSDGQYLLLNKDGDEFVGVLGYEYANEADANGTAYMYYWGETGSYAIDGTKEMLKYDSDGNLSTTTDLFKVDYQKWDYRKTSIFGSDRVTPMVLRTAEGTPLYPYAVNALNTSEKYAWATWDNFFTGKYGGPTYSYCKENLNNPIYDVGTLKAGESKTIYIYFMWGYLAEKNDILPNWQVKLSAYSDEGAQGSLTVKMYLGGSRLVNLLLFLEP